MALDRVAAPPRGTRPSNRRELILAAATTLFHEHGYDRVSMSAVAAAVNVRPSALYRHFAGKPQLFSAALVEEMTPMRLLLTELADADLVTTAEQLAAATIGRSRLGLLWQREARGLPAEEYAQLRSEIVTSVTMLADLISARRPELSRQDARLLASSTYSVLCSVSYRPEALAPDHYAQVLQELITTVLFAEPAPWEQPVESPTPGLLPVARRERLLHAAIALFADYGYSAVSMEDIGSHAGIAGASIYHHFASKQQLLATALQRGGEWLRLDMYRALAAAADTAEGLQRLLRSYLEFAVENSASIDLLISEARHLDENQYDVIKQSERDYLGEWIHLMRATRHTLSEAEGRVRAHATFTVINDLARTPRLRTLPSALETVYRIGASALKPVTSPETGQDTHRWR